MAQRIVRTSGGIEAGWQPCARETVVRHCDRMQPTPEARVIDLRGRFADGQALAGSGALVWEGEVLDRSRFN